MFKNILGNDGHGKGELYELGDLNSIITNNQAFKEWKKALLSKGLIP